MLSRPLECHSNSRTPIYYDGSSIQTSQSCKFCPFFFSSPSLARSLSLSLSLTQNRPPFPLSLLFFSFSSSFFSFSFNFVTFPPQASDKVSRKKVRKLKKK